MYILIQVNEGIAKFGRIDGKRSLEQSYEI